jgi:hypothetical protein
MMPPTLISADYAIFFAAFDAASDWLSPFSPDISPITPMPPRAAFCCRCWRLLCDGSVYDDYFLSIIFIFHFRHFRHADDCCFLSFPCRFRCHFTAAAIAILTPIAAACCRHYFFDTAFSHFMPAAEPLFSAFSPPLPSRAARADVTRQRR